MGNLEALKTRLIIQLQDEFEDSVFNLILTKLTSIINKNKDALAVAVEKIKTVVEEYSQPKFKFEFKIPDGLKAENIHISLDGKAVHIRVKDQVISCGIKNNVQAILEDFGSKFAALYDDVDLSSLITLCLSENLDRFNHELREYEELKSEQPSHQERLINPSELDAISDRKYDDYVIGAIQKTVKLEPRLIRQIFTTAVSTYTPNPINLGIIAPTSEGKTHPVIETLEYFPNSDVWYIGSMSPKTLIRLNGLLVDSNNSPIGDKVKELRKMMALAKNSATGNIQYKEELEALLETSKTVIDFSGKILAFLEPPDPKLWEVIKPILSHDKREIEYPFVNATDKDGIETKKIVVRGWPACIFCSAKDESGWQQTGNRNEATHQVCLT